MKCLTRTGPSVRLEMVMLGWHWQQVVAPRLAIKFFESSLQPTYFIYSPLAAAMLGMKNLSL